MRLPGVQIASHGRKQRCPLWWSQFLWSYPTVVLVFPNMELSVIPASAWIYIWNAWIMQIFSFLLHLTLSSIKSINHPIRWSQWPVIFPHTHTNTAWKTAAEQLVRNWWGDWTLHVSSVFMGAFGEIRRDRIPLHHLPLCESCYFADYEEAWWSYCFPSSGRNVFSPFCLIQEVWEGIWAVVCERLVSQVCYTSRKTNTVNTVNIRYSTPWSYNFANQNISKLYK